MKAKLIQEIERQIEAYTKAKEEEVNYHRLKSVASPLAHCIINKSPFGVLHNGGDRGWFTTALSLSI